MSGKIDSQSELPISPTCPTALIKSISPFSNQTLSVEAPLEPNNENTTIIPASSQLNSFYHVSPFYSQSTTFPQYNNLGNQILLRQQQYHQFQLLQQMRFSYFQQRQSSRSLNIATNPLFWYYPLQSMNSKFEQSHQ
jgi:hypothetical protein